MVLFINIYFRTTVFLFVVCSLKIVYLHELENCVCVPYWQCKDDYSGLIEDEVDIIDIRILRSDVDNNAGPCKGDFDVCCHVECGRRNSVNGTSFPEGFNNYLLTPRILGENNEAAFAEFPWMLAILKGKIYKCGGSLIHPQVALTAAHCIQSNEAFKVRAGEHDWSTLAERLPYQERMTKKILIHPHYHPHSLRNDIALLILDSPFKLAENIGIVCLPPQNKFRTKMRCITSGWGKNSYKRGTYQTTLKKLDLPLVSRDRCLKSLQEVRLGPLFKLHESFICAGGEENKDACKGDGGSPLIGLIDGVNSNRYEQIGIVSWGLTCGLKNTPGVYVNVAMFRNWIDRQMLIYNFDINVYKY